MKECCKEAFQNAEAEEAVLTEQQAKKGSGFMERLKDKWQAKNILQVVLILCTFTIGGSLCGYLGRKILGWTGLDGGALWVVLYILLVTILWPACVLLISIFFGQFKFFRKYIRKIGNRMIGRKSG